MDEFEVIPMNRMARFDKFHLNGVLAQRFELESKLSGHKSCVNRLAWNSSGSYLLSGSDDRTLTIFPFPDYERAPLSVETLHEAHIFGVQFLPYCQDRVLISGAMDGTVQVHMLESGLSEQMKQQAITFSVDSESDDDASFEAIQAQAESSVLCTHEGKVKDVEVDESDPYIVWSVSEDGTVRQVDIRQSYQTDQQNILIQVHEQGNDHRMELKGIDINKVRPHQLAVACGDVYVRLYDRRMLSVNSNQSSSGTRPVMMLAPPHMTIYTHDHICATSYVHFANRGDKLVCLYRADHCYSFDITSEGTTACSYYTPCSTSKSSSSTRRKQAYSHVEKHPFWLASDTIRKAPDVARHYIDRGHLLSRRTVHGDQSFALRDYEHAIALDADCKDAYFHRCHAVMGCYMPMTANRLFKQYLEKFPEERETERGIKLKEKLKSELERKQSAAAASSKSTKDDEPQSLSEESKGCILDAALSESDEWTKYYCHDPEKASQSQNSTNTVAPKGIWWTAQGGKRLLTRYVGQFNAKTDIKECTFLGQNDSLVACGSDDGKIYIYDADTGRPLNILKGDHHVVNCVQCHPSIACLASSGIDATIKLWSPGQERVDLSQIDKQISANESRLLFGPVNRSITSKFWPFSDDIQEALQLGFLGNRPGNSFESQQCRIS